MKQTQNSKGLLEPETISIPYIPERFTKVIKLHMVKNILAGKGTILTPLLLGLHGPSGDGKTFQCEHVLEQIEVRSFLISGGQLENPRAGEPAQLIRSTYRSASDCLDKGECVAAAMLINDFDTGVGNWGDLVQYTGNRQIIFSELMHLTDYPHLVEGRTTQRIPIIITGNDFTRLYEPMCRAGRMTSFEWKPTTEEKIGIIAQIFPELNREEQTSLVETFAEEPIAFFSHLRSTLIDEELYRQIQQHDIQNCLLSFSLNGKPPSLSPQLDLAGLLVTGQTLVASGKLSNHLSEWRD